MSDMINIMTRLSLDTCSNCLHADLELYDIYDKPINYKQLVQFYEKGRPTIHYTMNSNRTWSYFKCKHCGKIYIINWTTPIPTALTNVIMPNTVVYRLK